MLQSDSGDCRLFMMPPLRHHPSSCIKFPCCLVPPPPPQTILWPQAADWEQQFGPAVPMHRIFSAHPKDTADTEHHQPPPPTQGEQDRSTMRMLPHTRVVRLLKTYLECHRGKKIFLWKEVQLAVMKPRVQEKYSKRNHLGLHTQKKQSVPQPLAKCK